MFIAITAADPATSARSLPAEGASAYIKEAAQCLSSALRISGVKTDDIYKMWQATSPYVTWAAASRSNFNWLVSYAITAAGDFARRTGKPHQSLPVIQAAAARANAIPVGELTPCPAGGFAEHVELVKKRSK